MKRIEMKAFAKINLSLDVQAPDESGMHPVDTVMQQVELCDIVRVETDGAGESGGVEIAVTSSDESLPTGKGNLAYKAAALMAEKYGAEIPTGCESIKIHLEKHIPVAAGLAGGSSNAAAVLLALNELWELKRPLEELLDVGALLGSDIPFCISGQARGNGDVLSRDVYSSPLASYCARGRGTGTELSMAKPLTGAVLLAKPDIALLTAEVYKGFDKCQVAERPDNDSLCLALEEGNRALVKEEMINLLELYSLKAEPLVAGLKSSMAKLRNVEKVLMSGSGPTVYALFTSIDEAKQAADALPEDCWTCPTHLLD